MLPLSLAELAGFAGLCLVLAATPGANLAVVLRCAADGGQRAAIFASAGLAVSKAFWAVASLAGLATLLAASAEAYAALRLLGAAYLVWLGVQAIRGGRKLAPENRGADLAGAPPVRRGNTGVAAFRRGLTSDLLNPKVGLFYTTVFPQFIDSSEALVPAALLLFATHAAILMVWYPSVVVALARAGRLVKRNVRRWTERTLGAVLIMLGIRLAVETR